MTSTTVDVYSRAESRRTRVMLLLLTGSNNNNGRTLVADEGWSIRRLDHECGHTWH